VMVAAWRLWRRWRASRPERAEETGPTAEERRRAAHLSALERLRSLRRSDLLTQGQIEPFYVELTDIVRRYIGDRFGVPAIDRTTAELRPELEAVALPDTELLWLAILLGRADLSKFARTAPSADLGRADLDDVEAFVERTRLRSESETPSETRPGHDKEGGDDVPVR
jgi:hypothetical protein